MPRAAPLTPILLAALLVIAVPSCRAVLRSPAAAPAPEPSRWTAHSYVDGMNPFLLTDLVAASVVVEVDWVEGARPTAKATRAAELTLRKYCPAGKRIRVQVDDEIPRHRWEDAAQGARGLGDLAAEYVDHDPAAWEQQDLIWVLYVPRSGRWFGEDNFGDSTTVTFERDGELRTVSTVLVSSEKLSRSARLWITAARIDRSTLVHELGHKLGLVSHPGHSQKGSPGHCSEPQCVMTHPRLRSLLYGALPALLAGHIPRDYCRRCRDDIRRAQVWWKRLAAADPTYVRGLCDRRLRAEREAQQAWLAERGKPAQAAAALDRVRKAPGFSEE